MKPARRKAVLKEIFKNGESLGWLLGEILGDELFNHGITGNRKNTERQIFTLAEMNEFIPIMNKRLAGKDKDRIGKLPNPVGCLYRWQQSSNKGKTQMAEWVKTFSKTDAGFLKLMELCRGTSINSDIGVHHPLNKRELKLIYGSEQEALARLEKIAKKSTNAAFKTKAKELLSVVADPLGD